MVTDSLRQHTSSPRYLSLAESLHGRIVSGDYPAGSRLPTEKELAEEYGMAVMTVRQGVGLLVKKGMVERRQGLGTFVTGVSQAVANIALLFGDSLAVESAHYYRAILHRLQNGALARKWDLRHYDRMNRTMFPGKVAEKNEQLLLKDHRNDPFHGIIEFAPGDVSVVPRELVGHIPMALYETASPHTDVLADDYEFGEKAVTHLVKEGCRNLLFFCSYWHTHQIPQSVDAVLDQAKKMQCPPPFVECVALERQGYEMERELCRTFQRLVASWEAGGMTRPDGLIFNDDITLRSVLPALLKTNLSVPESAKIFCHGNNDWRFYYGMPVCRYEISPGAIAGHLLKALDCRIRGVKAPAPFHSEGRIFIDKP